MGPPGQWHKAWGCAAQERASRHPEGHRRARHRRGEGARSGRGSKGRRRTAAAEAGAWATGAWVERQDAVSAPGRAAVPGRVRWAWLEVPGRGERTGMWWPHRGRGGREEDGWRLTLIAGEHRRGSMEPCEEETGM